MSGLDRKPAATRCADTLAGEQHPLQPPEETPDAVSTKAEDGLYSEAVVIKEQEQQAQPLKDGEDLLPVSPASSLPKKQPERSILKN